MGTRLTKRIEAGHDPDKTGGKIISPIRALRKDPAANAEKALTAEAPWHDAEPPVAGVKTAAGTEPASNAAIFSENKNSGASRNLKISLKK